jgi:hypothetical protein
MGKLKLNGGLGFQDLENFNKALLVKQSCCVLQNLVIGYKILKVKHVPASVILNAQLGN